MTHLVIMKPTAADEMDAAYDSIAEHVSVDLAERWIDGMLTAAGSLEPLPTRGMRAMESDDCGEIVYQLLVGRRPHVYPLLYVVGSDRVHVVHLRHAARRPMTSGELVIPPIDVNDVAGEP